MFFVTKYLDDDSQAFQQVQDCFGRVYEHFDKTMDLAIAHRVEYLTNARYRFGENELLTFAYHYSARHLI
jgi:predicted solute-binding protein